MIIKSILDDDLYKFTTMWAILNLFPDATAEYHFINRGKHRFNQKFISSLQQEIYNLAELSLLPEEKRWFQKKCKYLPDLYFHYLQNYHYNPEQVKFGLTEDNNLWLTIKGPWKDTVLWEVKLLAIISELYFLVDTHWDMNGQIENINHKGQILDDNDCALSEFGTRRRRNFITQDLVIQQLTKYQCLKGTSNLYFAMKYDLSPQGSFPHEWTMGNGILESLQHPDYYAMHNWAKIFNAELGSTLSDSYGLKSFLRNFNLRLAKLFNAVRNDSGDPFVFTDMMVQHYKTLGINPVSKFLIFSNALDIDKTVAIRKYCSDIIPCSFGVGTFLTNNFPTSPALNIVIKLAKINNIPCVKLSDDIGKECGDTDALKVMKYIHRGEKLCS
jgi:nicotinate phosphoribosyltransferase